MIFFGTSGALKIFICLIFKNVIIRYKIARVKRGGVGGALLNKISKTLSQCTLCLSTALLMILIRDNLFLGVSSTFCCYLELISRAIRQRFQCQLHREEKLRDQCS